MKWDRETFFPTNPDLANIVGDMDFEFSNFHFYFVGGQIPRFPEIWPGPALGRVGLPVACPRVGPQVGLR